MKVVYVIYNEWNQEQRNTLAKHGFLISEGYQRVDIEENEKNRNILKSIDDWKIKKFVGTTFDKKDYDKCSLFLFTGIWEFGYPQPENNFGYMEVTYDTSKYCKKCGIGAIQNAPFQIKKEPNWGKKMIFELNWVLDELFVRKDAYEELFKRYGVGSRQVLQHKKNFFLEGVLQLEIPVTTVPLKLSDLAFEICDLCKKRKFDPQIRGFFPDFAEPIDNMKIFKSSEYFGSGGQAFQRIFITRELFVQLKNYGIKPNLIPVK